MYLSCYFSWNQCKWWHLEQNVFAFNISLWKQILRRKKKQVCHGRWRSCKCLQLWQFRDRGICCMQSKSITYKQYLLKKQKKKQKKNNIKNDIILGYKFEHAKVNIKVCSLCMRVTEKKNSSERKYISFGFLQHSSWKSWHQF